MSKKVRDRLAKTGPASAAATSLSESARANVKAAATAATTSKVSNVDTDTESDDEVQVIDVDSEDAKEKNANDNQDEDEDEDKDNDDDNIKEQNNGLKSAADVQSLQQQLGVRQVMVPRLNAVKFNSSRPLAGVVDAASVRVDCARAALANATSSGTRLSSSVAERLVAVSKLDKCNARVPQLIENAQVAMSALSAIFQDSTMLLRKTLLPARVLILDEVEELLNIGDALRKQCRRYKTLERGVGEDGVYQEKARKNRKADKPLRKISKEDAAQIEYIRAKRQSEAQQSGQSAQAVAKAEVVKAVQQYRESQAYGLLTPASMAKGLAQYGVTLETVTPGVLSAPLNSLDTRGGVAKKPSQPASDAARR